MIKMKKIKTRQEAILCAHETFGDVFIVKVKKWQKVSMLSQLV